MRQDSRLIPDSSMDPISPEQFAKVLLHPDMFDAEAYYRYLFDKFEEAKRPIFRMIPSGKQAIVFENFASDNVFVLMRMPRDQVAIDVGPRTGRE